MYWYTQVRFLFRIFHSITGGGEVSETALNEEKISVNQVQL